MSKDFVERQIILGAGASDGYPLGSKLIEQIIDIGRFLTKIFDPSFVDWNQKGAALQYLSSMANEAIEIPIMQRNELSVIQNLGNVVNKEGLLKCVPDEKFLKNIAEISFDIKNSCATSIDFYTSRIHNIEKQKIIESLIAAIINSYSLDLEKTWYGHLLPLFFPSSFDEQSSEQKISSIEERVKNIKVITFNYDLSLEEFLYSFLRKNIFYKDEDGKYLDKAKAIIFARIEHVYGFVEDPLEAEYEKPSRNTNYLDVLKDAYLNREKYSSAIKLIESDRGGVNVKISPCNYLYVFGFGFDPLNIEVIGLNSDSFIKEKGQNIWARGCFVTNYKDNQKIKRIILNNLCRLVGSNENWAIPIISRFYAKKSLERDFSLLEMPNKLETIPANQTLRGNYSPYFALCK